jgi:site-specific recombinase XerD
MPRLSRGVPTYRKHRASGQAIVTLSGQDFYLGPHGTKVSHAEYDRQIAEWLARGRRPVSSSTSAIDEITVVELIAAYKRHAEVYYRKHGKVTNEVTAILSAARVVKQLYGREPASTFGPLKLQAVQQAMIKAGWCRRNINKQIGRVVRMFGWGVSQELVAADVAHALREVKGLHKGRTEARETSPVMPVEDSVVNTTLEHLPPVVADMVRFQRLTGCRPEEVCLIRPMDVEATGPAWAYRPESHKAEHHGRDRVIFIGPKAQDILRPYLLREKSAYCFSPTDSERKRRAAQHEARKTPLSCGNRPGTNRSAKAARPAGERYTTDSYRRAIHRACGLAFPPPDDLAGDQHDQWRRAHQWHPNRLRHSAATEIRKRFGLEAAQVTLGHSAADVTQVYAERDMEKAAAVMAKIG